MQQQKQEQEVINKMTTDTDDKTEEVKEIEKDLDLKKEFAKQIKSRDELIAYQGEEIQAKNKLLEELQDAVKKSSFVSANNIPDEKVQQVLIENTKLKILLGVKTKKVNVERAGEYVIYSDPVSKLLELRDGDPRTV